jgi:succinate dehydrogenase/fumarate reductase flavoprotein subunit
MDKVQIHPTGWVDPSDPHNTNRILTVELMRRVGGVLINDEGQR